MRKTAIEQARDFLSSLPQRTEESLVDYNRRGNLLVSELKAHLSGPGKFVNPKEASQLEVSAMIREIEDKTAAGSITLNQVRNEIPQNERVTAEDTADIDWQKTISNLALISAQNTFGDESFNRMYTAESNYLEYLEPMLPDHEEIKVAAKSAYENKVEEYLSLTAQQLKEAVDKEFPTDEWIGKKPEPAAGDYGKVNEAPPAETEATDSNFQKMIDDEKRHRGITSSKTAGYEKIADSVPPWLDHKDDKEDKDDGDSEKDSGSDHGDSRSKGEGKKDGADGEASDKGKESEKEAVLKIADLLSPEETMSGQVGDVIVTTDGMGNERYLEKNDYGWDYTTAEYVDPSRIIKDTRVAKTAVDDRSGIKRPGDGSFDGAKHPDNTFVENFESESKKNHGQPRGPNRRRSDDVPAYSTPKDKLTAAVRSIEANYEVDEKTAHDITRLVLEAIRGEKPNG